MKTITLTEKEYFDAQNNYLGYCLNCGEEKDSCEPDATEYHCEYCGKNSVYGTEELLIMGRIELK